MLESAPAAVAKCVMCHRVLSEQAAHAIRLAAVAAYELCMLRRHSVVPRLHMEVHSNTMHPFLTLSVLPVDVLLCLPQVGVIEDTENRERLAKLLRFHSSKNETDMVGLQEYVGRMKEGQKAIYFMVSLLALLLLLLLLLLLHE